MSRQSTAALAAILGALIGLGALAGVIYALRDSGDDGEIAAPELPATEIGETGETGELEPIETQPVEQTRVVPVGGFPNAVAATGGAVWVMRDGRKLPRIDPEAGEVVARVGAGAELGSERPCGLAVGNDAVWAVSAEGSVARIVPERNRVTKRIAVDDAACIASGAGGIWVTSPNRGVVTRLDPFTSTIVTEIAVDGFPQGIDVGFGSVWVAAGDPPDGAAGAVVRINPRRNEPVAVIPLDSVPEFLAVGAGGVFVTADDGTVRFIDPGANEVFEPAIQIADEGRTVVAIGGGAVWALAMLGPGALGTAVRIDPETLEVVGEPIPVGTDPRGLAFGAGSLWVANYADGSVTAYTP